MQALRWPIPIHSPPTENQATKLQLWKKKAMFFLVFNDGVVKKKIIDKLNWFPWRLANVDQTVEKFWFNPSSNRTSYWFLPSQGRSTNCWSVSKKNIIFRVYLALSKHHGGLGNFETVVQTRDVVKVLHNFREFSQAPQLVFRGHVKT